MLHLCQHTSTVFTLGFHKLFLFFFCTVFGDKRGNALPYIWWNHANCFFFDKERPSQEKSHPNVQIFQGKVGAIVLWFFHVKQSGLDLWKMYHREHWIGSTCISCNKSLRFLKIIKLDLITNEQIRCTVKAEQFWDGVIETRLRWFGPVLRSNTGYSGW